MKESNRVEYRRMPAYKYQTVKPLVFLTDICPDEEIQHPFFTLQKDGVLTVNAGYAWDGASGPAIDTKSFLRGSLAHDVFYQMNQLRLPIPLDWKDKADDLLARLVCEDGMSKLRCWWVRKSVGIFGRGLPRDLNQFDETLIAP